MHDKNSIGRQLLAGIYNFKLIDNRIGTGGQPSEGQFEAIRDAGFEAVLNLALPTSDNAIPHEGQVVTSLGMSYFHIPVNFQNPTAEDFQIFCSIMKSFARRSIFVHCAANMRVSAFVFLYRVRMENIPVAIAETDLKAIWEPDEIWSQFIQKWLREPLA